jgi:hypothetical protein
MIRIAVLSEQVASQLRTIGTQRPPELENIEIVWSGTSQSELKLRGAQQKPQVIVVELSHLSEPYRPQIDSLLQTTGAELALVLYAFARRDVIRQLTSERTRTVKVPVSLAHLRLSMLSLLVRDAFSSSAEAKEARDADRSASGMSPPPGLSRGNVPISLAPSEDFGAALPAATPRQFRAAQLGRLQSITSQVRCECTNQLAEIVTSLAAFEDYSQSCENQSEADAAIHAKLYRETSRARRIMEEALRALCRVEGIEL